jgi:hypothetical protein
MKTTLARGFQILSIALCVLVLLASASAIVTTWVTMRTTNEVAIQTLDGIDQAAQGMRDAIGRVDNRVGNAQNQLGSFKQAGEQLAQNVSDKGLVLTLLPPQKEQQLQAAGENLASSLASFHETALAVATLVHAVDQLPFVSLPEPDQQRVQAAEQAIDSVQGSIGELTSDVRQAREGSAGAISRITPLADTVDGRLAVTKSNLGQVDGRLASVQDRVNQYKQTVPTVLFLSATLITLLLLWIIYSQLVLLNLTWKALRSPLPEGKAHDSAK